MAEENSFDRSAASAEAQGDAAFAARLLADLPSVPASGALQACILADFDAVAAKRNASLWAVALRPVRKLRDAVWPSAPAWQPASIFALSLVLGLAAGALVPSSALTGAGSGQDETQTFDTIPSLDLSGDF
jgi:hypothetical protein